jgi:hypothetical protein
MATYTATDGTVITVNQIVITQGQQGIFQAVFSGLGSPAGLPDEGFSTSVEMAIANLYQAAHTRRLSGQTGTTGVAPYR